ncbi:MAG TPA: hypothetical protein PKD90_04875 [Phnomibacter sp.]|nr:hypothetical protein [Phnomibacter sp.]
MNKIIFSILCFGVFFEELVCVYLPPIQSNYFHNFSDLITIVCFAAGIINALYAKPDTWFESIRKNWLVILLIIVPLLALARQWYFSGCVSIGNYWTFVRFILIFWFVRTLKFEQAIDIFKFYLNACFAVSCVIGLLQAFMPSLFLEAFMPAYTELPVEEGMFYTGGRPGEMSGFFAHTIHYAYLMLIKLLLIRHTYPRKNYHYALALLILFLIYNTTVVFTLALAVLITLEMVLAKIPVRKIAFITIFLVVLFAIWRLTVPTVNQTAFDDYLEQLVSIRFSLIVFLYIPLLTNPLALIGVSNCSAYLTNWASSQFKEAPQALVDIFLVVYEDVFYGAFILYFGYVSLILLMWFLYKQYAQNIKLKISYNGMALSRFLTDLLLLFVLLNFANQTLKVKIYSFVMWFFIALLSKFTVRKQIEKGESTCYSI